MGQEVRALIVLSLPLAVARLGSVFMGFVDTVMAGRIGPRAIAALALANTVFFLAFIAAMGTLMALEPIIARAVGAGDDEHARSALNTGRYVAVALGVAIAALMLVAPSILAALGQPPDLVEIVDEYLMLVAIGAVPGLLFNAYTAHVTAIGKTRPLLFVTIGANVLNVILDYGFIHGVGPLPELGVIGIAASTVGCLTFQFVAIFCFVRGLPDLRRYAAPLMAPDFAIARRILSVGLPVGVQYGLEIGGFSAVALMMGLKGELPLAAHQIALNVAAMTFTVALGLSAGACSRVGQARGRGSLFDARRAGTAGFVTAAVWGATTAALIAVFRFPIARLYTNDAATLELAQSFLLIAAVFQLADCVQAVGFGVLRGFEDTKVPLWFNILGYWCFGLPLGYVAAFVYGDDPRSLWWGLTSALFIVAVALILRFRRFVRGELLAPD